MNFIIRIFAWFTIKQMQRIVRVTACILAALSVFSVAQARETVVVDSLTGLPLPNASAFNRKGVAIGVCKSNGRLPRIPWSDYPITIRSIGYNEAVADDADTDSVKTVDNDMSPPEVVSESRSPNLLPPPA